ncbi:MAG: tetratricopeptide repeat protein [Myxococcota bacterium]
MKHHSYRRLTFVLAMCLPATLACQTTRPAGATTAEAEAALDQAIEDGVTTVRAAQAFQDGAEHLKAGRLPEARVAMERAIKADPSFALAKYNLGVIAEKEGQHDVAAGWYQETYQIDPTLDLAVENLGVILEARGQRAAAESLYRDAIQKNPEAVYPRLRLAKLARLDKDPKAAVQYAREALQFDATSVEAYRLLARLYAENEKNQLARLISVRGQKMAPNDPALVFALAIVAQNEKDVAMARELLNRVIQADPDHLEARAALAEMALAVRDWKTAEPQLVALLQRDPKNGALHTNLGLSLKGQGRFDEAAKAYQGAVALQYAPAALNLGILLLRNQNAPEQAEKTLEQFVALGGGRDIAQPLLDEAKVLIEAKREEQRMLELMEQQEAEAARQAENAPPPTEGPAEASAGDQAPAPPTPSEQVEEASPPSDEVVKETPRPKQKPRKSRAKPDAAKKEAPRADDSFFD